MEFKSTPLFGGAIVVDLPSTFQDVSEIRQIPDNQEVYLDRNGYTSIVFDILERVTDQGGDLQALDYHLSDIVEGSGEVTIVEQGREVGMGKIPGMDVKGFSLLAKAPPVEKQKGRPHEAESVGILVLLVRLESVETDLVITVNVPCGVDGNGEGERLVEQGKAVRERVVGSLEVRDWGLFGGE